MDAAERQRKSVLVTTFLKVSAALAALVLAAAFLEPNNDAAVTIAFYALVFLGLAGLWWLVRRGHPVAAVWALAAWFWLMIAFVTLTFGGLRGETAACFVVVVMLIGTVASGRAGVAVAIGSSVWCGFVAWLDAQGRLPPQLGPQYSPINAWAALSITLVLTALLMSYSLRSVERAAAERDEALRRSIQSQKMEVVGKLASSVAHDFNNLLMVISATSEQLRLASAEERDELLRDLDDATSRAALLTRQLLSFARSPNAELVPLDAAEAVRAFGGMLARLLGSKIGVTLDVTSPAWLRGSRAAFEQILLNLAVNAREAMPSGGALRITLFREGANLRLDFADTGVGMDAATLEKIFHPFFTTRPNGTGLGLSTVKERVTHLGGTVTATSAPGAGSTFTISLPAIEPPAAAGGTAPPITAPGNRSGRLLLVEDEPRLRRATTGLLEQAGYEVIALSNGAEALRLLSAAHSFVCVVSDVSMPELDGDELSRRLEALAPSLPMVLMSGNRAPALGVSPRRTFVEKPVARAALLAAIDRVTSANP